LKNVCSAHKLGIRRCYEDVHGSEMLDLADHLLMCGST
jgi:hypothetical protein